MLGRNGGTHELDRAATAVALPGCSAGLLRCAHAIGPGQASVLRHAGRLRFPSHCPHRFGRVGDRRARAFGVGGLAFARRAAHPARGRGCPPLQDGARQGADHRRVLQPGHGARAGGGASAGRGGLYQRREPAGRHRRLARRGYADGEELSYSNRFTTPSRPLQLRAQLASARTTGLARNATDSPASAIIFRSLAPSPMATLRSFAAFRPCSTSLNFAALASASTISPTRAPVSLPSFTSSVLETVCCRPRRCLRRSVKKVKPPDTSSSCTPCRRQADSRTSAPGVSFKRWS